jgi:phosphoenolpyruvate synthase/pyruvate phosphate dikinase
MNIATSNLRLRWKNDLPRCAAIQPMVTHLVPLAAAVVERRGGMLIHGAIIARELGLPCVNGVAGAIELLRDGDIVTVDGYLGIVTVGTPEFDLELADVAGNTGSRKSRKGV